MNLSEKHSEMLVSILDQLQNLNLEAGVQLDFTPEDMAEYDEADQARKWAEMRGLIHRIHRVLDYDTNALLIELVKEKAQSNILRRS